METQEWWKKDFEKKHWGAMFECGDYESLLDDVSAIIAEAVRRRDAELLKKLEGMKRDTDCKPEGECSTCGGIGYEDCHCEDYNLAIDDIIKLIKGG